MRLFDKFQKASLGKSIIDLTLFIIPSFLLEYKTNGYSK